MLSFKLTEPEKVGVQEQLLSKAIEFAIRNESKMDRDIGAALEQGHFEEPRPCLLYTSPSPRDRG